MAQTQFLDDSGMTDPNRGRDLILLFKLCKTASLSGCLHPVSHRDTQCVVMIISDWLTEHSRQLYSHSLSPRTHRHSSYSNYRCLNPELPGCR